MIDNNNYITIEQLVDLVQSKLTFSGSIPCYVKNEEIERIIQMDALPYFYNRYKHASTRSYFYVPKTALQDVAGSNSGGHKCVQLPDYIRQVAWVYGVNDGTAFQLGMSAPAISVNTGATNQPYVSSFMSTIGEMSLYRLVVQGFSDTLQQLNKSTYKKDFNINTKVLTLLTKPDKNLILEAFENISPEYLFADSYFLNYVVACAKITLGNLLTLFDMPLAGDVKINGEKIGTQGEAEKTKIEEEIKLMNESTMFMRTVKR